ncbi:unnamed protein product [Pleuronectes platessa]|uniref:Uncharacterized protein n=1 Tax=Pleuronectes platessa TaxID=8262 RepID=A0A9N7YSW4_PLEPL|nr:unnamed protein product [Pleuronectes platessa]
MSEDSITPFRSHQYQHPADSARMGPVTCLCPHSEDKFCFATIANTNLETPKTCLDITSCSPVIPVQVRVAKSSGAAPRSDGERGRGDSASRAWHVHSGTDGHEGPYGLESVPKLSIGTCFLDTSLALKLPATMGQTDPQREWLACRREGQEHNITNVSRSAAAHRRTRSHQQATAANNECIGMKMSKTLTVTREEQ